MALVPMRHGEGTVGLIQAASRRRGRLSLETVEFLETVARRLGGVVVALRSFRGPAGTAGALEGAGRSIEARAVAEELGAALAHEMKNPLAGMMLAATRLRKALKDQGRLADIAGQLCDSINALSETVTRLTDPGEPAARDDAPPSEAGSP